jgi:hypothetical protein
MKHSRNFQIILKSGKLLRPHEELGGAKLAYQLVRTLHRGSAIVRLDLESYDAHRGTSASLKKHQKVGE